MRKEIEWINQGFTTIVQYMSINVIETFKMVFFLKSQEKTRYRNIKKSS